MFHLKRTVDHVCTKLYIYDSDHEFNDDFDRHGLTNSQLNSSSELNQFRNTVHTLKILDGDTLYSEQLFEKISYFLMELKNL